MDNSSDMNIIEGVGDEIIHIAIGVGVICLSVLAWWSTHIRDVALYRTIVIVERNRHNGNGNHNVIDNNPTSTEPLGGIPVTRNVRTTLAGEATESESEDSSSREPTPTPENQSVPSSESVTSCIHDNQSDQPSSPCLQSERPLLVGDYVNPSLQNPPIPFDSEATSSSDESDIQIRLKYLNDEERVVDGKMNELLGDFKKRHFRTELSSNKVVRLIYNGHILQPDNAPLSSCGLFNNCVIHCLVHPRRNLPTPPDAATRRSHSHIRASTRASTASGPGNNSSTVNAGPTINERTGEEWGDFGSIFYILISICLCSAWYWRFQYSHLFSFTATAALSSITAIFSIFVFSITFFHNEEIPIEIM